MAGLPTFDLALTAELEFILELGVAIALALFAGAIAVRLRQPPIVGYLIAGVVIGPFTPGFVGDPERISELAEVGVILLLFALGVEFSLRELARVRAIVVPGAIAQILLVTLAAAGVATVLGLDVRAAIVVGGAISISSTLVVLKLLLDRGETDSLHGRVAIGWMIVQDIAAILMMAILPPLAGGDLFGPLVLALVKAALFLLLAYVVGTRLLPWLFNTVSRLGSPELFLLAVFATALITAFVSSAVFGLSLALGAFVAGLIVSESELSHQAAGEVTPFRDLFAVLFFVSVGMLLDPSALLADLPALVLLLVVALAGKSIVSAVAGRLLGMPIRSAILLGATIAQVGEFSFLIAEQALHLEILDARAYNLILATAVLSIVAAPLLVQGAHRLVLRIEHAQTVAPPAPVAGAAPSSRGELAAVGDDARVSVVVLGAGRVGRVVIRAVRARGFRCVVVDRDQRRLEEVAGFRRGDPVRRRRQPGDPRPVRPGPRPAARRRRGRPADRPARGGAGARHQSPPRHRGTRPRDARDPAAPGGRRAPGRRPGAGGGPGARPRRAPRHGRLRPRADGGAGRPSAAGLRRRPGEPRELIRRTAPAAGSVHRSGGARGRRRASRGPGLRASPTSSSVPRDPCPRLRASGWCAQRPNERVTGRTGRPATRSYPCTGRSCNGLGPERPSRRMTRSLVRWAPGRPAGTRREPWWDRGINGPEAVPPGRGEERGRARQARISSSRSIAASSSGVPWTLGPLNQCFAEAKYQIAAPPRTTRNTTGV